jgi:alpha-glucosidase
MSNGKVKRLLGRFRNQNQQPIVDSSPTQRAKPRSEFSWNDLKINLKMLLLKTTLSDALYKELLIPTLTGPFDKELYVRWLESVCLVPFFQDSVVNKQFTDSHIRSTLRLRQILSPYLHAVVALSRDYKWPMLKSLDKVEPDNPKVHGIDDCYLLGDSLLIAPVLVAGATQRYVYLPTGQWYNYWNNSFAEGGQYIAVEAPVQVLPIFVRAGTLLPLQPDVLSSAEAHLTLVYRLYPGNKETVLYEDDSEGFNKERTEYRWIYITCGWQDGKLVINRRIAGQYIPDYTHIRLEIVGLEHEPLHIRIDRRPAPVWFFDQNILEFTTNTFQIIEIVMDEETE